jgi:hypothetical protein
MSVKLHRCRVQWSKWRGHPCWRVEKALIDMGVDYERVPGPAMSRGKRVVVLEGTGQQLYPALQFEDGSWYREESKEMERRIRAGRLDELRPRAQSRPAPPPAEPEPPAGAAPETRSEGESPKLH